MISWVVLKFILVIYSNVSQFTFLLLDSWPWLEGSYELGLAVLSSGSFLGIDWLVFSGTQDNVGGHLEITFVVKNGENVPKMSQICRSSDWSKISVNN